MGGEKPGVAGAATEHPLERVESNEVRTRGIPPPSIQQKDCAKAVLLKRGFPLGGGNDNAN